MTTLGGSLRRPLLHLSAPVDDRGDVPGWVMVTVMTAALVAALYAIAGPALAGLLTDALANVLG
jgi:hypothetical protein